MDCPRLLTREEAIKARTFAALTLALALLAAPARDACTGPAGNEGDLLYDDM